jgi:hypothetical protein
LYTDAAKICPEERGRKPLHEAEQRVNNRTKFLIFQVSKGVLAANGAGMNYKTGL